MQFIVNLGWFWRQVVMWYRVSILVILVHYIAFLWVTEGFSNKAQLYFEYHEPNL